MKKKVMALLLSTSLVVTILASYNICFAETASETNLLGQVTEISGTSITLALGTENKPGDNGTAPSEAPSGEPPAAPSEAPSGDPPAAPSDDGTQTPPSDGGGKQRGGGLTLTGETQTITVTDSTVITTDNRGQSSSAALSNITVGSILRVTVSDGSVTAIVIMPSGEAQQPQQKGVSATASTSTVTVNGSQISFQAYNINDNNYFKLRDIAKALNGTGKQFEVGYDSANNAITLKSETAYTVVGGELENSGSAGKNNASLSTAVVYLDGTSVSLTAYLIGDNNYFKLRDLASALNFGVTYDSTTSTIVIDTSTGYTA